MDTFKNNPFAQAMSPLYTNTITVQKELAALTESQLKLAQAQLTSGMDAWRAAFVASHNATQAMAKVWTDSLKVEATA